jgi:uncharacterized membrane protein ArfC
MDWPLIVLLAILILLAAITVWWWLQRRERVEGSAQLSSANDASGAVEVTPVPVATSVEAAAAASVVSGGPSAVATPADEATAAGVDDALADASTVPFEEPVVATRTSDEPVATAAGVGEEAAGTTAGGRDESVASAITGSLAAAPAPELIVRSEDPDEPFGPGSAPANADGSGPEGWTIKGNADSGLYHTPSSPAYKRTRAEAWFESEEAAQAAGFARWDWKQRRP